jgi:hypothetical protein
MLGASKNLAPTWCETIPALVMRSGQPEDIVSVNLCQLVMMACSGMH